MDADYADDIMLLANTPAQAEFLLHSLEWETGGIGLHVNPDKTEYMCFNQKGDISVQKRSPLKQMDKFTNLGNSISSIKNDINTWLAKAWTVINRLSVIWKSDLTWSNKTHFIPSSGCVNTTIWMHHKDVMKKKCMKKKLDGYYTRMLQAILNKSWRQTPHKTAAVRQPSSHLTNHPIKMKQACRTLLEK